MQYSLPASLGFSELFDLDFKDSNWSLFRERAKLIAAFPNDLFVDQ